MQPHLIIVFEDRKFVYCDCTVYFAQNRNPDPDGLVAHIARDHESDYPVAEVHWFDTLEDIRDWVEAYPEPTYH